MGVDVFFVISGLITSHIARCVVRSGRFWVADFHARRPPHLQSASLLTLGVTVVVTLLFLPIVKWRDIGEQAVA